MDSMVEQAVQQCAPCQVVTDTPQREPLKMIPLPEEPWTHLRADLYGPVHTGEYILVVQCQYSRFPVVEIVSSTGHKAVIPALDRIMTNYGIPEVLGCDNGPPFNGKEFTAFAKYMGFKIGNVTPLAPWANGMVERFMPNLTKLMRIAKEEGRNWRQELHKYLRAYRATPHKTTGFAPAHSIFNGRTYRTRLPKPIQWRRPIDHGKMKQNDAEAKSKMKWYADKKSYVKPSNIQVGDRVLCRQDRRNKMTTPYFNQPMTVTQIRGSRVTAMNKGRFVTRHLSFFKRFIALVKVSTSEPDLTHFNKAGQEEEEVRIEVSPGQTHIRRKSVEHQSSEVGECGQYEGTHGTAEGTREEKSSARPRRRVQLPTQYEGYVQINTQLNRRRVLINMENINWDFLSL